jgi:hypothetical protein
MFSSPTTAPTGCHAAGAATLRAHRSCPGSSSLHVSGHYHHENGPRGYGRTTSYALAQLVDPKTDRWLDEPVNPEQRITAGAIGLLDTRTYAFEYVHDAWLADVKGDDVDVAELAATARTAHR